MRTIIVGGVAGGMSAATRLRRLDGGADIVVFERGHYVSFANCGLPYFVGGVIEDRDALLLQTPASLAARFRLDVRADTEVIEIDPTAKTVEILERTTGVRSVEHYHALILAAGATAARPVDVAGVPTRTLRTIEDIDDIVAVLDGQAPGAALVVGGGFIGLEAVDNLIRRGVHVTLVQRGSQVMSPLDPELAAPLVGILRAHGVDVRLNTTVQKRTDDSTEGGILLSEGSHLKVDLIIDAAGVVPDLALASAAGLRIGDSGGIWVDEFQRTSDPSIYAVGDGVEKIDELDGRGTLVTMAGLANRHGRLAADAIAGLDITPAEPALGVAIVQLFDTMIAMVGSSERDLVAAGRPHRIVHTHPSSHATYYRVRSRWRSSC